MKEHVVINTGENNLSGVLSIPEKACGIVIFAHGSGSSSKSPRNIYVTDTLNKSGIATLLFDLLTSGEQAEDNISGNLRFNIPFLTGRLVSATDFVLNLKSSEGLPIGYFGASTGAAAALLAADSYGEIIKVIVSRGGRPDLAKGSLENVRAATLFIIGGNDYQVIKMNQEAFELLKTEKKIEIIPGATHLFEEPGTLEKAAELAVDWFFIHFKK